MSSRAVRPQGSGASVPAPHTQSSADVAAAAGIDPTRGLAAAEVVERRREYGPNRFTEAHVEPIWQRFLRQYRDLMQIVLLVAGVVSIVIVDAISTGALLIVLTVFNALMGMSQEGKAAASVAALQEMMIVTTRVRRDGALTEVAAEDLVPGDIVAVEAGDLIPADGRLLSSATLEVDESPLTGESLPVAKDAGHLSEPDTPLGDRAGMVYMNTSATRGSAAYIVTATGMATEVGHISKLLETAEEKESPLTRQLDSLTQRLILIAGLALIASMALGLWRGQEFQALFVAAVAFAVAAIPTGLPAIVTTILSKGTQTLADAGAIVKRLRSVETLGSTSAINSDKTGTLTLNEMTAVELAVLGRRYEVTGTGYGRSGSILHDGSEVDVDLQPHLLPMVLASDAVAREGSLVGDPTEGALVVLAAKGGVSAEVTRETYPRIATLPFDAAYKLMATFHEMNDADGTAVVRAYVKGAPDQLLARAAAVVDESGQVVPLTDELRARVTAENERLARKGLRVLATASKDVAPSDFDAAGELLEAIDDLTLMALIGIMDPPRPEVKDSIATAHRAGIQVRMITGDHVVTAESIGRQLGLTGEAISGADFRAMSDDEAMRRIDDIGIIARVTPEDKVRLVELLQRQGRIVSMTGDGVNDAPALKQADIGVAMGITGTEVSKEAAVMILTDDDFSTIIRAVRLGRNLYDNLRKYIRFQMAGLFGFIATFLGASLFWIADGVPFLPAQTIWVNFSVQAAVALGLGYGAARAGLMDQPPRPSDAPILTRQMLIYLAVVGLLMGLGTLAVIGIASQEWGDEVGRSMGLATFSFMNIAFALATKDMERSVFRQETIDDRILLRGVGIALVVTFLASELGLLQRLLGTVGLTLDQWIVCLVVGFSVLVISEVRKRVWPQPLDEHEAMGPSREIVSAA